jgi:alanine racemase
VTDSPLAPRIEVSASALRDNLAALRDRLGPGRSIAAVLKANAYGHGRDLVAGLIADEADMLAAADPADALALADAAPGRCLSLGPAHGSTLRECIERGVQVTVSDELQLGDLLPGARVHLLVDTGLHRLGVAPERAAALARGVRGRGCHIEAVCCMVARADQGDWDDVAAEISLLRRLELQVPRIHTGGSSVALERPDLAGDMGRTGLAVLGYHPRAGQRSMVELVPSLRLVAPILELRVARMGERVGYQAVPLARETTVATLPLGLGHGLHPDTDPACAVELNGRLCPHLCTPSLDYSLVDVTDAPGAEVGAEATVIGGRPGTATSVADLAERLGVIVDRIVAPLAESIRRVAVA